MSDNKKLIIDEQLVHGLGERIIQALAHYFKIEEQQIRVSNDDSSPEHTLVYLDQVDVTRPKIKLRLQELGRHQRTEIHHQTEDDITDIEMRIEDSIIVEITEKVFEKLDKKT